MIITIIICILLYKYSKNKDMCIRKNIHEIRNSLSVINICDDKEIIKLEIDKINRLLSFKPVDKCNKEILDINMIIDNLVKKYKNIINIEFNNNDEIYIDGDYNKLDQVFTNIIKNSIEANSDKISIDVNKINDSIEIDIHDNGNGIKQKDIKRIFKQFYSTKKYGSGLGVNISNKIINSHNGDIKYISNNKGTIVKITLPYKNMDYI